MHRFRFFLFGASVLGLAAASGEARAGLLLTAEAAGVQATRVSGATTETFDKIDKGVYTSLKTAVGTLSSPGLAVVGADSYGGAGGKGRYFAVGAQSGNPTATLTLNGPESYFGFWWSAADPLNGLEIYSKGSLVATFDPAKAVGGLDQSYLGNPNNGQDGGEKFAYLNFVATDGTTFDQVVFRNANNSTGFEADNFSIYGPAVTPVPGTGLPGLTTAAVPEPSSMALSALGLAIGLAARRRRRAR